MPLPGTYWQAIELPLNGGLRQRRDPRVRPSPFMTVCQDAQFDLVGGVQTRLPYGPPASAIAGGGTLASTRRIVAFGDELVLFTADTVYSWNDKLSAWVPRGTHLAVAVNERSVCATNGDQIDGDRAELAGTVVIAWTEATKVYAAALDKVTGSVLAGPSVLSSTFDRPRVIALSTKILIFTATASGNTLTVRAVDPATPAAAFAGAGTTVIASTFNGYYDVVADLGRDRCLGAARHSTTTNYTTFAVTSALAVTSVVKARACDGPIAVSFTPDVLQIVRANGTNIVGDLLSTPFVATFADLFINQAIGTAGTTPVNQIAIAHRSVLNGGARRCYAFWSAGESPTFGTLFQVTSNWIDTANAHGTQATFANGLGIGSRAFDDNGSIFVWLTFGQNSVFQGDVSLASVSQAQNAYILYRDDGFIAAKAAYNIGGGLRPTTGLLPGVALTGTRTYSWIGTVRRRLVLNNGSTSFAARTPHDITFQFDSNAARRCARLGRTLYIAAGEILQYDGVRVTEVGFHFYPWSFDMLKAGSGNVATGKYGYKITWRWTNAQGESERSTTATEGTATMTAGPGGFTMGVLAPLNATHKTMTDGAIAAEVWRTAVNPQPDSPFLLASSPNPTQLTNPNKYVPNDAAGSFIPPVAWRDEMDDATLTLQEPNPENGLVLEDLVPPAAQIITATDTRIFLAGVAGDPDRVWYSKLRQDGKIASFHDELIIDVPRIGGAITSVRVYEETLHVFRSTAIYALPGSGLDNESDGQNFGPARVLSLDVGAVSDESVAVFPGGIIFKSRKGWQVLGANGQIVDISEAVSDFDAEDVLAIDVIETQRQVRVLTAARMIVWDYEANQWATWSVVGGAHACMYRGAHVVLMPTGTRTQLATYDGVDYGMDIETSWIKPANATADAQNDRATGGLANGYVRKLQPLGEVRTPHLLRMRVAYDYDDTYREDKAWSVSPSTAGVPLQLGHGTSRRKCQAVKVRMTACRDGTQAQLAMTALSVPIGTDFGAWNAVFQAVPLGLRGNAVTISLAFDLGDQLVVDVREHFAWSFDVGNWIPAVNNIGVHVVGATTDGLTASALESAILSGAPELIDIDSADPIDEAIVDISAMAGISSGGVFAGGTFVAPDGEALKLTGLGLEVGLDPGLYNRLPKAQKQ